MTSSGIPAIEGDWALFLDLDGTLLDIAPRPDAVVVPPGLVTTLQGLSHRLDGALAVVTGRARVVADTLLAPLALPGGFGHGAELRDADGRVAGADAVPALPSDWPARLAPQLAGWRDVILEIKPHGLALHYRAAPQWRDATRDALLALLRGHDDAFALLPAQMAFEIRPRAATKARAVHALMQAAPFRGRRPVFVGDDVTDEDGMAAARDLGGLGLHVGRDFQGGPTEVRAWLEAAHAGA
ncbi:trehalose-phosphatase [Roseomonas sp. CECT 9278]|uniref:trehalose-phosphatase n=1 Tax=Roseomonas sp. CECT 9278 TaxID=2845823 RepID=UPI001E521F50|nr:trehalose-phosphatase [Roseomonas sp. CECT 9278]CAH0218870.1 Trehalose-6-phosphate phosphatase [Roseomonas sp. CECT 9278]